MQANTPKLIWLEDPEVFEVNRIEAHSDHKYYESTEEVISEAEMSLRQSLNGMWYFSYAKNPSMRVEDFYKMDFDCKFFDKIKVLLMKITRRKI